MRGFVLFLGLAACSAPLVVEGDDRPGDDSTPPSPSPEDTAIEAVGSPEFLHLPVFRLDTGGEEIPSGAKIGGTLEVIRVHAGTLEDLDEASVVFSSAVGIELHGSSSLNYPKLGYRMEIQDPEGGDLDYPLLDMPAGSDWVLHAPYSDKTLIRNALAYSLGRDLAEPAGRWEPRTAFAEVFLNGSYIGVYVVTERVRRGDGRLDLPAVAATAADGDLSGGYVVKVDQHRNLGFDTAAGTPIDYAYPRAEDITPEQARWLARWFNAFEAMLQGDTWTDEGLGWPAWIDADAWVDHYLLNELAHNIDAYRLSAYLWKDVDAAGGRLHAGPLWDFDRAFGNVNYCDCWEIAGFIQDDLTRCGYGYQYPPWWGRLLEDPAFTARLRCRWDALRAGPFADGALQARVAALVAEVTEAEPRDHARWETIGTQVEPNWYVGESWADEVAWLLDWTLQRAAWLDGNLPGECS